MTISSAADTDVPMLINMKKVMPFHSQVDQEDVVESSDFSDDVPQFFNDCSPYTSISKDEYLDATETDLTETEVSSFEDESYEELSCEEVLSSDEYQVKLLKEKLAQIHAHRRRDVRLIDRNKILQLRKEKKATVKAVEKEDSHVESQLITITDEIEKMRAKNKKLRDQNNTLHKANCILTDKNKRTEESMARHGKNEVHCRAAIKKLQHDAIQIKQVHDDHVLRVKQFEGAIGRCVDNTEMETTVSLLTIRTIEKMMNKIRNDSDDEKLIRSLEEAVNKAMLH